MKVKRLLGLLLTVSMLLSMIPAGFAASATDFVDFPTGWSKTAMTAAVNNGLLYGFNNGEIRPQSNLTRAEMAAVITRSFGAVTKADISAYSDVSPSAWYYDSIAKAVKMGAMQGDSATTMSPEKPITREELFTVFARVLVLSSSNTNVLDKFKDASQISSWAKEGMAALVERGYVNGDEKGFANPKANITREEFAQVMHNAIRTYITEPGTYTADMEGITVIRVPDVTVKDLENTSDLVIGDGVGTGNIYITNLKIGERILARGGTITIKSTTLGDKVVVNNVNGVTHFNNYRDEKIFKNIVENTVATFLKRGAGIMGSSGVTHKVVFNGDSGIHYDGTFREGMTIGDIINWVETNVGKPAKDPDPDGTEYEFAGWVDSNGDPIDPTQPLTGYLEIFPAFVKVFKVTYKYQDETAVTFDDAKFGKYSEVSIASYVLPTKDNITNMPADRYFVGLYKEKECNNEITNFSAYVNGNYRDLTIYVKTLPEGTKAIKYQTVTAFADVDWEFKNNTSVVKEYDVNTTFPIAITADNVKINTIGYRFKGWTDKAEGGSAITEIAKPAGFPDTLSEIIIYADFELIEYNFEIKGYDENKQPLAFTYDNYTPANKFTVKNIDTLINLDEIKSKIVAPDTYEFSKWVDQAGNEITLADIKTALTNDNLNVVIYAQFKKVGGGSTDTSVNVTFTDKNGTVIETKKIEGALGDKFPAVAPKEGHYIKWFDKKDNSEVGSTTPVYEGMTVYYDYIPYEYKSTISGVDEDGNPIAYVGDTSKEFNYNEIDTFISSISITPPVGYLLEGLYVNGQPLTEDYLRTLPDGTIVEITAKFKLINYAIKYFVYTYDDNEVKTGSEKAVLDGNFNFYNYDVTIFDADGRLPVNKEILNKTNRYELKYWEYNDAQFTSFADIIKGIDVANGATPEIVLYAVLKKVAPYEIKFYEGYHENPEDEDVIDGYYLDSITVYPNETVKENGGVIPEFKNIYKKGYIKDNDFAKVYSNNEYTHLTFTTPKYIDGTGKLVDFDENVVITEAVTYVYMMHQQFAVKVEFGENGAVLVSAFYDDDTRIVDSSKDMLYSGKKQLQLAIDNNILPKYDEIKDKLFEELEAKNIIDGNKNIKLTEIAIPISKLVQRKVAEGMVKQFIRDTINNEAELDKVLQFFDIKEFISGLDIKTLIDSLTDQQILDLIKNDSNRSTVIGFIYEDLNKENSKMLDTVVSYVTSDATFRSKIVDDLMKALMDKSDTSALKDQAITHLKKLLITDGSDLQDKFATMLIDSLTGENANADLKNTVITEIKKENSELQKKFADMLLTALKSDGENAMKTFVLSELKNNPEITSMVADSIISDLKNGTAADAVITAIQGSTALYDMIITAISTNDTTVLNAINTTVVTNVADKENGADLRKAILTSGSLSSIVTAMKSKVIDLIADKDFIKEVLTDDEITKTILNAVINEPAVIAALVGSKAFVDEIVPEFHTGGIFENDVRYLIGNESGYKDRIFDSVLVNEEFVDLIKNNPEVEAEIRASLKYEDIVNEDDLIKYIFGQDRAGNTTDYSFIITQADIEARIAEEYNALSAYASLSDEKKATVKNIIYNNITMKNALKTEILTFVTEDELEALEISVDDIIDYVLDRIPEEERADYDEIAQEIGFDKETTIADALATGFVKYESLSDTEKQDIKNNLFGTSSVVNTLKAEMQNKYNKIINDTLEGIKAGSGVSGEAIRNEIDVILSDYVEKYISQDNSLNKKISEVVENILIEEIRKIILTANPEDPAYVTMKDHIDLLREHFIGRDFEKNKEVIKASIADFAETNNSTMKNVINNKYDELSANFVGLIKPGTTIYNKVEELLITEISNIDSGILNSFIVSYSSTEDGKKFIKDYISKAAYATIASHVKTFLATPANEAKIRPVVETHIGTMDLTTYITDYAKEKPDSTKNLIINVINSDSMTQSKVEEYLNEFLKTKENRESIKSLAVSIVKGLTNAQIANYLADFLKDNTPNQNMVRAEVEKFFNDEEQIETIKSLASDYVKNPLNKATVESYIADFIVNKLDIKFVQDNRAFIKTALEGIDVDLIVSLIGEDGKFIKDYIAGLSDDDKIDFSNKIFDTITKTADFKTFMDELFTKEQFNVTKSNYTMVTAVANAIGNLEYDSVMANTTDNSTVNALLDLLGEKVLKDYFNKIRDDYVDGLNEVLERVNTTGVSEKYTTSLSLKINVIDEVLVRLYDAAQPKVEEKIAANVPTYNDNKYIKYLLNHDIIEWLLDYDKNADKEELTGYAIKDIMEYYDYIFGLILVGDDALTWYGDDNNISEEELQSLFDAMFGKVQIAHAKLNGIIEQYVEDGTLPSKVEEALNKIKQLNDLILKYQSEIETALSKYLGSDINLKVESGEIFENENIDKVANFLFGKESPVITIDTIYNVFYYYDDSVQAKLKDLKDSGKLEAAIEKFENTSLGEMFKNKGAVSNLAEKAEQIKNNGKVTGTINRLYDLFVLIADYGIEPFKVNSGDIREIDSYEVSVGGITLSITRNLR